MFVRATCFSYIDFLDIDGLINLEVGNKNVQRFETERFAPHESFTGIDELTQGKGTRSKCHHLARGLNCVDAVGAPVP
jgi:hypothetical protein